MRSICAAPTCDVTCPGTQCTQAPPGLPRCAGWPRLASTGPNPGRMAAAPGAGATRSHTVYGPGGNGPRPGPRRQPRGARLGRARRQRLDLVREGRRWPQPEYRFKHALIQEAAYGTILSESRRELHRKAAEWLEKRRAEGEEEEVLGLLAYHWLAAEDEEKAVAYLTLAGDSARAEYALDEAIEHYRALPPLLERRGERQASSLVLFKLALASHTPLRFGYATDAHQSAFARRVLMTGA